MRRLQDIAFGVEGQKLLWDAPEGRPTSVASVQVFRMGTGDDGTAEQATNGSASVDLVSTTVNAASGDGQANPRLLRVVSISNMATGREYLVTSADGAKEWVEAVELDSATPYLKTRYPMANAFASSDTVVGTRLTVPLDASWVSDSNKLTGGRGPTPGYRVRWVYTVASVQYVHDAAFDLVRYVGGHTLVAADVDREYPGIQGMGPGFHRTDGYRALLDQAYERVRWDLVDIDLAGNAVLDQDALNRATMLAFGILVQRSRVMQGADSRLLELAQGDYDGFLNKVFRSKTKVATSGDSSGAGETKAPSAGVWARR